MTSDEVTAFTARIDLPALRSYWDTVGARTLAIVKAQGTEGWETVVDPAHIRRTVRESGDYGPRVVAERTEAFYAGMTRGWAFAHLALTHTYAHFGEATVVRSLLGFTGA